MSEVAQLNLPELLGQPVFAPQKSICFRVVLERKVTVEGCEQRRLQLRTGEPRLVPLITGKDGLLTIPATSPHYPGRPFRMGREGDGNIRCTLQPDGRVRECAGVSETPLGFQFMEAAVLASPFYRLPPPTSDRPEPVDLTVRFTLEGYRRPEVLQPLH